MQSRQYEPLRRFYELLEQGEKVAALQQLLALAQQKPGADPHVHLQLAAGFLLFQDATEQAEAALQQAASRQPAVKNTALYRVLDWQLHIVSHKNYVISTQDLSMLLAHHHVLIKFHAARSLFFLENFRAAAEALGDLPNTLPCYLDWLRWSSLAKAQQQLHNPTAAIAAYQRALKLAHASDLLPDVFELTECYLQQEAINQARDTLQQVQPDDLQDAHEGLRYYYLQAVIQRLLGKPQQALKSIHQAQIAAQVTGDESYHLPLECGRLQMAVNAPQQAVSFYQEALRKVPDDARPRLMHEYASLLSELAEYSEASSLLERVVAMQRYEGRAEALAELADVTYLLGYHTQARQYALSALKKGAAPSACLCLAKIALETFRFDEAEAWLEKAVSSSNEGDEMWLAAQVLLAEMFRRQQNPERMLRYAEKALRYLHPQDEWVSTLKAYVTDARQRLDGHDRLLN